MAKIKAVGDKPKTEKRSGGKSKTGYPYYNLKQSIEVAGLVHSKGGGTCTRDQLASFLKYSTTRSGAFLTRVSAAKMFGLIDTKKDSVSVTERAKKIIAPIMPEDALNAKVEAFLAVPLFRAVYERFHGSTLPADVGLKNLFENQYHIVKDRIIPALRVLLDSADQAGFFEMSGRNKLIKPIANAVADGQKNKADISDDGKSDEPEPSRTKSRTKPPTGGGDEPPGGIHTAIIGLLRELPKPGAIWPRAHKQKFLHAFQYTLDFIYPEEEEKSS